jgi:hypothetical protein
MFQSKIAEHSHKVGQLVGFDPLSTPITICEYTILMLNAMVMSK